MWIWLLVRFNFAVWDLPAAYFHPHFASQIRCEFRAFRRASWWQNSNCIGKVCVSLAIAQPMLSIVGEFEIALIHYCNFCLFLTSLTLHNSSLTGGPDDGNFNPSYGVRNFLKHYTSLCCVLLPENIFLCIFVLLWFCSTLVPFLS